MITSTIEAHIPTAEDVSVTGDTLQAELADGRTIAVPLCWPGIRGFSTQRKRNATIGS